MLGIIRLSSSIVELRSEFTNSSLYRLAMILMVRLVPIDLGFGESGVDDIGIEGLIEWAYKSWPNFSRFVSKYFLL